MSQRGVQSKPASHALVCGNIQLCVRRQAIKYVSHILHQYKLPTSTEPRAGRYIQVHSEVSNTSGAPIVLYVVPDEVHSLRH